MAISNADSPPHGDISTPTLDGEPAWEKYHLRLFVSGMTPRSTEAIARIKAICEEYLEGRYELEVVDIYQLPINARSHQIVATPTLIKLLPLPLRKLVGDLSDKPRVLKGLNIVE